MFEFAGCSACKGRQVFRYYMIERPDGIHMVHLVADNCQVCHQSPLPDPWISKGWTEIDEGRYNELNDKLDYFDHDI